MGINLILQDIDQAEAPPIEELQFTIFRLDKILFAVDIMRIQEIVQPREISSLPYHSDYLDGLIRLRNSIIPVFNLRRRFGMPDFMNAVDTKLIIVKLSGIVMALSVDDVYEVVTVPVNSIQPSPAINAKGAECVLGLSLGLHRQVYMILNLDRLIGQTEQLDIKANLARTYGCPA